MGISQSLNSALSKHCCLLDRIRIGLKVDFSISIYLGSIPSKYESGTCPFLNSEMK